jgi:hypothetical protein
MDPAWLLAGAAACGAGVGLVGLRRRALDRWLLAYLRQSGKRQSPKSNQSVHLLLCIADHFEPKHAAIDLKTARQRMRCWVENYPSLFGSFRDSDSRSPQHTFFYPIEQYDAEELEALAALCRAGHGEVEIHLHHDGDTADTLRQRLREGKRLLHDRHGLLSIDPRTNEVVYGFVHGDWALDNSRPDGRRCGVNNELGVLRETGCYADFTMPSAPDRTQARKINSIYYAAGNPQRPRSYDTGMIAGTGRASPSSLMLIQGPLLLDWRRRKWGLIPRIENGCVQRSQPPETHRIDLWLRAHVQVPTRPEWFFVKLHAHGATEENQRVLLGEPMLRLHRALAERARFDPNFHFHYVTAREMYNLARAAETGFQGSVAEARDFEVISQIQKPCYV